MWSWYSKLSVSLWGHSVRWGNKEKSMHYSLATWRLLGFPTIAEETWVTPGGTLKAVRVPASKFSSTFWDIWREQSCQRDHIFCWTKIRSNPLKPEDPWFYHSPICLEYLTSLLGSSCNSLNWRIIPGSNPTVLDLQHMLHKTLRVRKMFLFLCSMVFCTKSGGMQVVWFWVSWMKQVHKQVAPLIFNDLLIPVLIHSAVTA